MYSYIYIHIDKISGEFIASIISHKLTFSTHTLLKQHHHVPVISISTTPCDLGFFGNARFEVPRAVNVQCVVLLQGSGPQNSSENDSWMHFFGPKGTVGKGLFEQEGLWKKHWCCFCEKIR